MGATSMLLKVERNSWWRRRFRQFLLGPNGAVVNGNSIDFSITTKVQKNTPNRLLLIRGPLFCIEEAFSNRNISIEFVIVIHKWTDISVIYQIINFSFIIIAFGISKRHTQIQYRFMRWPPSHFKAIHKYFHPIFSYFFRFLGSHIRFRYFTIMLLSEHFKLCSIETISITTFDWWFSSNANES